MSRFREEIDSEWKQAFERARQIRKAYEDAMGTPHLNCSHVLNHVIAPLMARYIDGQRTPELFDELRALRGAWE